MGFAKCIMSCTYHDSIIQKSFIALALGGITPIILSSPFNTLYEATSFTLKAKNYAMLKAIDKYFNLAHGEYFLV